MTLVTAPAPTGRPHLPTAILPVFPHKATDGGVLARNVRYLRPCAERRTEECRVGPCAERRTEGRRLRPCAERRRGCGREGRTSVALCGRTAAPAGSEEGMPRSAMSTSARFVTGHSTTEGTGLRRCRTGSPRCPVRRPPVLARLSRRECCAGPPRYGSRNRRNAGGRPGSIRGAY